MQMPSRQIVPPSSAGGGFGEGDGSGVGFGAVPPPPPEDADPLLVEPPPAALPREDELVDFDSFELRSVVGEKPGLLGSFTGAPVFVALVDGFFL